MQHTLVHPSLLPGVIDLDAEEAAVMQNNAAGAAASSPESAAYLGRAGQGAAMDARHSPGAGVWSTASTLIEASHGFVPGYGNGVSESYPPGEDDQPDNFRTIHTAPAPLASPGWHSPAYSQPSGVATQLEDDNLSEWSYDSQDGEERTLVELVSEYDGELERAKGDWSAFLSGRSRGKFQLPIPHHELPPRNQDPHSVAQESLRPPTAGVCEGWRAHLPASISDLQAIDLAVVKDVVERDASFVHDLQRFANRIDRHFGWDPQAISLKGQAARAAFQIIFLLHNKHSDESQNEILSDETDYICDAGTFPQPRRVPV